MSIISIYTAAFASSKSRNENLRFVILLLFAFSLPFDKFYIPLLLVTLILLTLLEFKNLSLKKIPKQFWIFQAIYYLGVIGYFYSSHKDEASYFLERQLSIVLFPIFLPLAININKFKKNALLLSLAISAFLCVVYLLANVFFTIKLVNHVSFYSALFSGAFFNHNFSKPLNIHAGYLSLYIGFSLFYLLHINRDIKISSSKILILTMVAILFIGLFFLASRNTIIAIFFIFIFVYPFFEFKNRIKYFLVALGALMLGLVLILTVPYLKNRFSEQLISDIQPLSNGKMISYSVTEPRIERWKCAIELFKKSPVIGVGTGDEVALLKVEYMNRGLFVSYLESFNAHNEYLSYLIKNGLIGLALFLLIFSFYFKLAIQNKDVIYLSFLILLIIGFYTENILDASKGIVFFAFFNTLLGYNCLENNKNKRLEATQTT